MGIWDAISEGEVPSWGDVGDSASAAGNALVSGADTAMRYTNPAYAALSYMHFEG